MFDIIKTIEKKTNSFSNKLNTGIKEKILANEIPRTTNILSCIIWIISISTDTIVKEKLIYQPISYMLFATTIAVYIPYINFKFNKKVLLFITVYAVSILMYMVKYFCYISESSEVFLTIGLSLHKILTIAVFVIIISLASNIKFALADEAFKQNCLISFKYSFIICLTIIFAIGLFTAIKDSKITINSNALSIVADVMLLVELITLYVIEKKFEKGLKCDDEEEEE